MMMLLKPNLASFCAILYSLAAPSVLAATDDNICGTVLSSQDALKASDAYACLTSTPFKADIAIELLDYWKTTLKFQSTLAYLRDPPQSYQQPPVDVLRGLDLIRAQIDTGVFKNQYAFEAAVQNLLQATHDGNVYLAGSVIGVFTFGVPINLVAISSDGVDVPRVYVAEDILASPNASPLTKINGELAEDFLTVFASENSVGYVEPHGDWNGLMYSAAASIQGYFGSITETMFYPGDTFTAEFANGTTVGPLSWSAYNVQGTQIPILPTGEDFYNFFVLGLLPESSITAGDTPTATEVDTAAVATIDFGTTETASADTSSDTNDQAIRGWGVPYPDTADVVQANLGSGGYLTGYFFDNSKTAVLSIPSFRLTGEAADSFSDTVGQFLSQSKEKGMEKIVIDLQSNLGGETLLAVDAFTQFFPNIHPFSGMRSRSFDLANKLGSFYTDLLVTNRSTLNESFVDDLSGSVWAVVESELNADTNANFTSWPEYYGPHADRGDQFSTVFTYNLTNLVYAENPNDDLVLYPLANRSTSPPYDARDIVILTDGACSSACDIFMELMHHEAGVRTIAIGGLPQHGPMQARGGARGAQLYFSDTLDDDIEIACAFNQTLCALLPNRTSAALDQSRLTLNFADQVRPKEYVPLQFVYEAADCRIFWKPDTYNNYTALWQHAADASFRNGTLCIPRSAEHNNTMQTDTWGPSAEQKASWAATNPAWGGKDNASISSLAALAQAQYDPGLNAFDKRWTYYDERMDNALCKLDTDCGSNVNGWICVQTKVNCGLSSYQSGMCKKPCLNANSPCERGVAAQAPCFKKTLPGKCLKSPCYCEDSKSANIKAFCEGEGIGSSPVVTAVNGKPSDIPIKRSDYLIR